MQEQLALQLVHFLGELAAVREQRFVKRRHLSLVIFELGDVGLNLVAIAHRRLPVPCPYRGGDG